MRGGWSLRKVEATATFMTLMKNLQEKGGHGKAGCRFMQTLGHRSKQVMCWSLGLSCP